MTTPAPQFVERGDGTPIVFVHGNGVDHRMMLALDDAFDDDGMWRRIYLDLPGFGGTAALPAPGGLPQLAEWLDHAMEQLVGAEPFAIVGASLGGLMARDVAARRLQQCLGIALLAPVVDSVRERRTLPEHEVLVADPAFIATLGPADAAQYTELAVIQSPENWERFRTAVLPGLTSANTAAMDQLAADYALPELPDARLAGFDRPVLIAAGRQDAVVGFADQWALAQRVPHATFAMLDRAGHNLHIDQPDAVHALLRDWAHRVHATQVA